MKKKVLAALMGIVFCGAYIGYKMLPPSVSVVMLTYRRARILPAAIDSILAQTNGDFEFIIINDGSDDNTDDVVAKYKDSRIRYYKNDRNRGIAYSRNRGASLARGKYIMIMDDDDTSYPNRIELQAGYLDAHPEIDVVAGQIENYSYSIPEDHDNIAAELLNYNVVSNDNVMYRRAFAEKHNIRYNEDYKASEDWDYWLRFLFAGAKFHALPEYAIWFNQYSARHYKTTFKEANEAVRKMIGDYFMPGKSDEFHQTSACERVKAIASKNIFSPQFLDMIIDINCVQPSQSAAQ